jgi:hypothetical protein
MTFALSKAAWDRRTPSAYSRSDPGLPSERWAGLAQVLKR